MLDNSKSERVFGIIIILLAALLRYYQLGLPSLWHDEAFTWYFTRLPWLEMLDTVRLDGVNPPVYYLVSKVFVDLFGDSELILRLLSAIAGIVSVYLGWLLGRQAGGRIGSWAGAWLIAFHPMAVHYARDARPYSLALAMALLLVYLFTRLREESDRRLWLFAFITLLLGQLTHYFFFVLGGALVLFALTEMTRKPLFFRAWMLLWLGAFLPLAGWMGWYFSQPTPSLGIGWIELPPLDAPLGTLGNLLSGFGGVESSPSAVFGLIVIVFILFALYRGERTRIIRQVLWFGLLIPIAGVWVISQRRPVYVDRYFIVLLPFVVYLFAGGAQAALQWIQKIKGHERWNKASTLIWAFLLFIGFWAGWQVHVDVKYSREDWRGLSRYLEENAGEQPELWLSEPEASVPMQYYYRQDLSSASTGDNPMMCDFPCWWVWRQPYTSTHAFSQAVTLPDRPERPDLPDGCTILDKWDSSTGLALWKVDCEVGEG
ncbi:MAG: hypothetical protein FVQ83_07965 [Chloroflexi bacterium]|nr:hypothetical protein [Chloroflexota bacterium]